MLLLEALLLVRQAADLGNDLVIVHGAPFCS
jgi:hypothetical protein